MKTQQVIITINDIELDAEVTYTPAVAVPAVTHLAPEDCCEAESEEIELEALTMMCSEGGMVYWQDISYLLPIIGESIKGQLDD